MLVIISVKFNMRFVGPLAPVSTSTQYVPVTSIRNQILVINIQYLEWVFSNQGEISPE